MQKTKASKIDKPRLLATQCLLEVTQKQRNSNECLDKLLRASELRPQERGFATALLYGCLGRLPLIDYYLAQHSKLALAALEPSLRAALQIGVWQLFWSYSIPQHAAVKETVEIVRYLAGERCTAYANALLRSLLQERPALSKKNEGIALGLGNELFGLFKLWYGQSVARQLALKFLEAPSDIVIRVNTSHCNRATLASQLAEAGVTVKPSYYAETALRLSLGAQALDSLPPYQAGLFWAQDEASQILGEIVARQSDCPSTILDLCAAPGGKSLDLALRCQSSAMIYASDLKRERLQKLEQHAQRLGISNIRITQADASQALSTDFFTQLGLSSGSKFSLVLADVPCSGLGLLGRKPEIRLHTSYTDLQRFPPLQGQILANAASLVRAGGHLLYSTCTINPAENQAVISNFLQSKIGQGFKLVPLTTFIPAPLRNELASADSLSEMLPQGMLLLRPDIVNTEGFFIALLELKQEKL